VPRHLSTNVTSTSPYIQHQLQSFLKACNLLVTAIVVPSSRILSTPDILRNVCCNKTHAMPHPLNQHSTRSSTSHQFTPMTFRMTTAEIAARRVLRRGRCTSRSPVRTDCTVDSYKAMTGHDYDYGAVGGILGSRSRSSLRKPASVMLGLHDLTGPRTRVIVVGTRRLTV
jgi:hypothetical protein